MTKLYTNNFKFTNLYKRPSKKSEITTQLIYGETFKIIKKNKLWWKIKIQEDGYVGYIKKRKFFFKIQPTHKISTLHANIFKKPNYNIKIGALTFGSKIKIIHKGKRFSKFIDGWIENKKIKPIKIKNKDIFFDIKKFINSKYKWGGKTYKGIDCSALVQIFFNYNNRFCPRDTKDQAKFFKNNKNIKNIKKNDLLYWRGHVAIAISKKKLIHAYGPKKKTIIMNIARTIEVIKKTANLNLLSVKRIN